MPRGCAGGLVVLACLAWVHRAKADDPLAQVLALEQAMQKAIAKAEPAIACILVSRSEAYDRFPEASVQDEKGRLGSFNPSLLKKYLPELGKKEFEQWRRKLDLADPDHIPEAFGSGVTIDAKGLIVTNFHVVQGARKIYVRLPGGKGSYADIHAADARCDLAVLKLLDRRVGSLPVLTLGDAGKLQRGQFLLSLANPFAAGFRDGQPSASWGILSNIRRRPVANLTKEEERTKPLYHHGILLQTDARLNLGCSGGALLNLQGELIGLTTSLAAIHGGETPGGFALPFDAGLRRLLDVLGRGEEIDYGFLGVSFKDQADGGALLTYVTTNSPADRDGKLRPNDVIVQVNGQAIRTSDDLFLALGTQLAGAKVTLDVLAQGSQKRQVDVTLAKLYVSGKRVASALGARPFFRGLRVDYASLTVQQPSRTISIPPGVLVSEVQEKTPAAAAHLKPGEIISHVNGQPVLTPAAFYQTVRNLTGDIELTLSAIHEEPVRVTLKAKE